MKKLINNSKFRIGSYNCFFGVIFIKFTLLFFKLLYHFKNVQVP